MFIHMDEKNVTVASEAWCCTRRICQTVAERSGSGRDSHLCKSVQPSRDRAAFEDLGQLVAKVAAVAGQEVVARPWPNELQLPDGLLNLLGAEVGLAQTDGLPVRVQWVLFGPAAVHLCVAGQ